MKLQVITVQVDTREQRPLKFPENIQLINPQTRSPRLCKVKTETVKLAAGDYRLKEYPNHAVVERKGSIRELHTNLFTRDMGRQGRAFKKLAESCFCPYLLIEARPHDLLRVSQYNKNPDILASRLFQVAYKYHLQLVWMQRGSSVKTEIEMGRMIIHLLLGCPLQEEARTVHAGPVNDTVGCDVGRTTA